MTDKTTYAVVDIETTGTSPETDKIIQFACVLVQNNEIINYFSTDVNPLKKIPKNIEQLTGISNEQVKNAPYFEDIAPMIKQLISDCVFVAHNVYFDYAFLNSELSRSGEEKLQTKCIDTVELSQILFPTSQGFRVTDLADFLELEHENPHQALSDAYVTAELFICLSQKMMMIPYVTLKKMLELSYNLGVDNHLMFEKALMKKEKDGFNHPFYGTKTIECVTLKNKKYLFKEKNDDVGTTYPFDLTENSQSFLSDFVPRKAQLEMMDTIYSFVNNEDEEKNLMVEASTGSGKSLGYLLPLSYNRKKFPIIVSTSTILLQEQLIDQTLEQVKEITGNHLFGMVLKSNRHFIDLDKFYLTLLEKPVNQKQYALNQMAILTWLMETETGDLDEINLNKSHVLFEHVKHRGRHTLSSDSLFFEEDFIKYLEEKKEVADVIVVNHAFLCEESKRQTKLIPKSSVLIIDESHKLVSSIENQELISISFGLIYSLLKKIRESEELSYSLHQLNNQKLTQAVNLLSNFSLDVREDLQRLEQFMIEVSNFTESKKEVSFDDVEKISNWPLPMRKNLKELLTILTEINHISTDFKNEVFTHLTQVEIGSYFDVLDYLTSLERLSEWSLHFIAYFRNLEDSNARWLAIKDKHLQLKMLDFSMLSIKNMSWYEQFEKIVYTSSTLQLDVDSTYFESQLDIPVSRKVRIEDSFNYHDKAKLLVISENKAEQYHPKDDYANYIAKVLIDYYAIGKTSMLVLFTSHHVLKQVYHILQNHFHHQEVDIFAQDITGTKEKIVKKYIKNNGGIILGANSFWEGVDLSLPTLDLIIMTKLPFDPPKRPMIEAKYHYLESLGKNPFYEEAIPQAGMRLRQGLGRLLRSENDRGVILLLDNRLLKASYSKQLLGYLPIGLEVEECTLEESLEEAILFFDNNN